MIHLGNYEEFFVLYIDNELSNDQMQMVDDFLAEHPDLQAEFEILAATKLPSEEFTIDKSELLAANMMVNTIDEELLLFMDNELSGDKRKVVELELASNKEYLLQYQLLAKTKLDDREKISYPNKKELYRRTETKVVGIRIWMRVAVAAILIASLTVLYFNDSSSVQPGTQTVATQTKTQPEKTFIPEQKNLSDQENNNEIATNTADENKLPKAVSKEKNINEDTDEVKKVEEDAENNYVAQINLPRQTILEPVTINKPHLTTGHFEIERDNTILNNLAVTPTDSESYNNTNAATPNNNDVASSNSDNKGSVKGFLRRATRLIEKRTGFDATNDGELLIGVVAVKLK